MIHNLLKETCQLIFKKMKNELQVSQKTSHRDLVSNVDQEIEAFLTSELKKLYPDCQILGEESNRDIDLNKGQVWIVDPIDGTSNFIAQGQQFGILLAHYQEGQAIEAYMVDVMKENIYHAIKGQGVTKNKEALKRDYSLPFKQSLLSMSACFFNLYIKDQQKLIRDSFGIRYTGSCAIDGISVIEGWLGAFGIRIASQWDIAPHLLFAEELGLVCINLDGSQRTIDQSSPFIFGQPQIVQTLLGYCHVSD